MDQEKGLQLYAKAQLMAATDEAFRKEILANPTAALEKLSGEKFPEGAKIKAIEQDPAYASTIVIPRFVGDELDESELDNVAGGVAVGAVVFASGTVGTVVFVGAVVIA